MFIQGASVVVATLVVGLLQPGGAYPGQDLGVGGSQILATAERAPHLERKELSGISMAGTLTSSSPFFSDSQPSAPQSWPNLRAPSTSLSNQLSPGEDFDVAPRSSDPRGNVENFS